MMNEGRADSPVPPMENRRSDSPAIPPTPMIWFEFLLKPGLLESHLSSENPGSCIPLTKFSSYMMPLLYTER